MAKILKIIALLIKIILILIGGLYILLSLVCFLGGPDGKVGSKESIVYGLGFLVGGSIIVFAGKLIGIIRIGKKKKSNNGSS